MKKLRASLVAVAVVLFAGPNITLAQTAGPVEVDCGTPMAGQCRGNFDGSEYRVYSAPRISWTAAKAFADGISCAAGVQPSLATLTRADEDEFVDNLRRQAGLREVWIGGSQQPDTETDKNANWFWENDEGPIPGSNTSAALGYRNWLPDEPNDNTGAGSEQHLAIGLGNNFGWNDEGNLGNIQGFIAECDAFDNNGIQLLTKNNNNIESVGQASSGEAGTANVIQCEVCRTFSGGPGKGKNSATGGGKLDLSNVIKDIASLPGASEGCVALDAELDLYAANNLLGKKNEIVMPPWMQPYQPDQCFTASLIQIRDANNNPVEVVDGVVLTEEDALTPQPELACANAAFVSDSPVTAGRAIPGIQVMRPETVLCNRSRGATRYSDRFQIYDVRLDSDKKTPSGQLVELGKYFNDALDGFEGCVDPTFLASIRAQYATAEANALSGNALDAVEDLQALTLFALNVDDDNSPYNDAAGMACPGEPKGEIGSTALSLSYHVWRGILYPSTYRNYADPGETGSLADEGNNPATQLRCLLPPFPTPPLDVIPAACADPSFLPAPFGSP